MSNLCVAGDTKIKVVITTHKETKEKSTSTYKLPLELEMQQLENLIKEGLPLELVEVLSMDIDSANREIDYHQITAFAQTSSKAKVMKITDEESGKSIVVTPEHKVFTENRGYIMAKDLKETDKLVIN